VNSASETTAALTSLGSERFEHQTASGVILIKAPLLYDSPFRLIAYCFGVEGN